MKSPHTHSLRIVLFTLGLSGIASARHADSLAHRTDGLFQAWDGSGTPGCAVAVIREGEVVFEKGYGLADLEHGVPITPQTVFYIGSVSKQFVTMCILLLEEEGRLSVDDDIRKHIPEFPEYEAPITIRHLVHHTSGIRDYLTLWSLAGRSYFDRIPGQAVLDMICRQRELNFPPGERFLYSNSCYFLLSVVVERVSGLTLREFAEANIFGPLGMKSSRFHDDVFTLIPDRAFSYERREDGTMKNLISRFDLVGSGGVYSTVEDLCLWDRNFYENKLGHAAPELLERMHTNGRLNSGEELDYAFAIRNLMYRGLRVVEHTGSLAGYRAVLTRFPDQKFSIIILGNIPEVRPRTKSRRIADIYLSHLMEPEEPLPEAATEPAPAPALPVPAQELAAYAGDYYSSELDAGYRIRVEDDTLQARIGYDPGVRLTCTAEDRFESARFVLDFQKDDAGRVTGFRLDAGRVKNLGFFRE